MKVTVNAFFAAFCLCCAVNTHLPAQPENLRFEHLSELQGLSQNSVRSILQDSEGFMWFGTEDGLNKYDGYTFTVLRHDPNDPEHTLHNNTINDIHEDRKGRLWVATSEGGLHQVDKHTGKVTHYSIMPTYPLRWDRLNTIYEDQEGILWDCGHGGVTRFDPDTQQFTLYHNPGEFSGIFSVVEDAAHRFWAGGFGGLYLLDRQTGTFTSVVLDSSIMDLFWCSTLYLDKEGILWVGTDGVFGVEGKGLYRLDTRRSPLRFTRYNPGGLISKKVEWNGIYQDAEGYVWICGSEGLHRIDKRTDQVFNFHYIPFKPGSPSHQYANVVYQDRLGALWIGTLNGISKAAAHPKKFHTHQIVPALPSAIHDKNNIVTLLADHTGKIWVGSSGSSFYENSHHGLYQFDPKTGKFKHLPANPSDADSLADNWVRSLYEDQKKQLWVGTFEALHLLNSTTGKFSRYPSEIPVEHIDEDPLGKLWVGGKFGMASFDPDIGRFKYYKYDRGDTTGLKGMFVNDIMASRTGDIWVALAGAGIARLHQPTDKFTNYLNNPTASQRYLNDKDVRALYEDAEGIVWVGTKQGGLNRFDPHTNTFTYFTMRDSLPSNHIVSIIGDGQGNLWLGTNKGISRFNPKTKTFRNFDVSDGLPANEFLLGSVYSHHGNLMFGSVNGFVSFHPDSIQDNTNIPPVYITGFKVLEKPREVPTDKIALPYDENFLSFDFVALNYDAPEKNQYAYQLEGVDKDWVYSGTRRFASYTNLDPREYVFRVKASNNDGIWNEEGASIQFVILPPWWRTWWAYTLYSLLALGMLWTIRYYEIKRLKLRHRAEHLAEVDTLKTRFFANISHEFRTPLTLILGPVKKMMDTYHAPDIKNNLSGIQRNAQRLLHLVNQLLDLSKLEAGKLKLEAVKSDIVGFLKARAYAFSSLADHKHIHFTVELPEEKIGAYFDHDKLEKIINNLLSNAFKFTPESGSVKLKGQSVTQGNKAWLQIQMEDSGKGIPEEEIDKIFDRFYQVDSSQTREQEGTGIGLALTKELVELHHGTIQVESTPGQGTTFTIMLPLGKEHLKEAEIIQELPLPTEETGTENTRIHPSEILVSPSNNPLEKEETKLEAEKPVVLIVEDHQEVRRFIRESISLHYQVQEAAHGVMGLKMARELLPDLIISDVMMPQMDGYQLCEKIKTDELTSHIPVILLTAKADRQSKLAGLETGADDYLAKPFDGEELQLIVRNRIEERRKMRERFSRDITLEPRSITITSLDEQFLRKVLDIIEDHMDDESFSIEELSSESGYSQMHFYRKIKSLSGQTPSQFLRTIRLKRAAAMLQQKSDTISQIAYGVGFNNLSYFNKCFKEQFGMTPGQYASVNQETE